MLKFKDWLKTKRNAQFKVLETMDEVVFYKYPNKQIKTVQRLKDDAVFTLFKPIDIVSLHELDALYIVKFNEDLITVDYDLHTINPTKVIKSSCPINSIVLNNDHHVVSVLSEIS